MAKGRLNSLAAHRCEMKLIVHKHGYWSIYLTVVGCLHILTTGYFFEPQLIVAKNQTRLYMLILLVCACMNILTDLEVILR